MKTRFRRISRRTVSMVLALLMMVSILGIGSLITANAATWHTLYYDFSRLSSGGYNYRQTNNGWGYGTEKTIVEGAYDSDNSNDTIAQWERGGWNTTHVTASEVPNGKNMLIVYDDSTYEWGVYGGGGGDGKTYYYMGDGVDGAAWGSGKAFTNYSGNLWYIEKSGSGAFKITESANNYNNQHTTIDNTLGDLPLSGGENNSDVTDSNNSTHYIVFDADADRIYATSTNPATGGGGGSAVSNADLLAVLNGTKIMFYGGELIGWGQSEFKLNNSNSLKATMSGKYDICGINASNDNQKYEFGTFCVESDNYEMGHWSSGLRTTPLPGKAYVVRYSISNDYHTQKAASGGSYLYELSNSETTTATTTIDSSITQGSNLSVSTSSSAGNSVLGLANSFEYYLYDGSDYYKVTPSSGEIDTRELPVGNGYKVITVLKDTNGLRVKADEDTFSVTAAASPAATSVSLAQTSPASGTIYKDITAVTYTATATGAESGVTYNFKVDGVSKQNTSSNTYTVTYDSSGTKSVTVTVQKEDYSDVTSSAVSTTVEALPTVYFNWNGDGSDHNPTMDYDAAASAAKSGHIVYKLSNLSWPGNSTRYVKIHDGSDRFKTSGAANITDNELLSGSGVSTSTSSGNGWIVVKTNSGMTASENGNYNFYWDFTDKKLYVEYPHKVTYNANGHGTAPSAQVVTYGGKATTPTAPTAAGYTFGGWFKEAGCTNAWDFSTDTVTANTPLYAKWTVNSHTLTVNAKYKSSSSGDYTNAADFSNEITMAGSAASQSKSLNYNATCTLVAPDKSSSGYDFVGWYDGDTRKSTNRSYTYTMPDENKTLTARYNKQYTLTLSSAHGTIKNAAGTETISKLDVFYDDTAPVNFKVVVDNGYKINNAGTNAATINKYFTQPTNGSTGTVTFTGATVATANKVDATITVDFTQITFQVDIGAYKTDDIDSTDFTPWNQAAPTISPALTNGTTPWSSSNSTVTKNGTTPAGYEFVGWYYSNTAEFDPASISRTYTPSGTGNTKTFAPNGTEGTNKYSVYALYKKTKYSVIGNIDGQNFVNDYDMTFNSEAGTYSYTFNNLPAATSYNFKIRKNHSYSDGGNWGNKSFTSSNKTDTLTNNTATNATIATQYSGDYTFTFNPSTGSLTVTYPTRNVTINTDDLAGGADPAASYITGSAYSSGDTWNLSASPDLLYGFEGWTWTVGGVSEAAGVTIADATATGTSTTAVVTTTETVVITAKFRKSAPRTATISAVGTNNGTSFDVNLDESTGFTYSINDAAAASYSAAVPGIDNGSKLVLTAPSTITSGTTTYTFVGWYSTADPVSEETALSANSTCTIAQLTSSQTFYARYKAKFYITVYNSWMQDDEGKFHFVAAPPKRVVAGGRTYTYAAGTKAQRGEDNQDANGGTKSEDHIVSATGTYYEGNKLVVYAGETVTMTYSSLATSDAIRGVFYNNDRRYSTEEETDNIYYKREYKRGGFGNKKDGYNDPRLTGEGEYVPDDDWDYTYSADTTLYADENYYTSDSDAYDAIIANKSSYPSVNVNNTDHTVSWTVTKNYYNVDLELDNKHKIHINNDDSTGLVIPDAYNNAEGYYSSNGAVSITPITIATSSDCAYSFTGVTSVQKKTGENTYEDVTDVTITPDSAENPTSYTVSGTMPSYDLYVNIGVRTQYTMKLNNTVICDTVSKKVKITQTDSKTKTPTGDETGAVGTIKAYVNYVKGDPPTSDAEISKDATNRWYYDGTQGGTAGVYTNNDAGNNYYINGGINETGSAVTKGDKVRYEFTFEDGKDAEYSFLGWFEGDSTSYDPTKKLPNGSGRTCEFTPKANTYVWAVATRNLYIQGDFDIDAETGEATSRGAANNYGDRYLMSYDAEYQDGNVKGRYKYTFKSVTKGEYYHYVFRDTATSNNDYTVWDSFQGQINANVTNDAASDVGTRWGRNANSGNADDKNAGYFAWREVDRTNGYECPVTVYFYPNASTNAAKLSVEAEYQWSTVYVSKGRGIDVQYRTYNDTRYENDQDLPAGATDQNTTTTFNTPTVNIRNTTVSGETVDVDSVVDLRYESFYPCKVKEKNGQIVVTADPDDENLDVEAFLVYNIETKQSTAVKGDDITDNGNGTYTANIEIPQNTKIYVSPIYKFTDDYISANPSTIESKTVYVRASSIDKNQWGGLVAMYSWGTTIGFNSGGWPGQLMIPLNGGDFYAPLTYFKNGLAGVTFNNFNGIWGGDGTTFVGKYVDLNYSTVPYSGNDNRTYQTYDYREPISIIDNISDGKYGDRDMDLTFALKPGNMTNAPTIDSAGSGAYNRAASFEYLMNRSGKKRVDLNGNDINNDLTATYKIVCNYTNSYGNNTKEYGFAPATKNHYSIDWTVYNADGSVNILSGSYLSASYTDGDVISGDFTSYIAQQLIAAGEPVDSKAVQIAYENPGTWSETIRYSGQWYVDGVDQTVNASVRVGVLSDGNYTIANTNKTGYGKATVAANKSLDASKGEVLTAEFSDGNSKATVTKKKASNDIIKLTATNENNTFVGWYISDGNDGYEPAGNKYKSTSIDISFTDDTTYYAFYSASASYVIKYPGRNSNLLNQDTWLEYTAKGQELSQDELNNNGTLDLSVRSDMEEVLSGANISVFNRSYEVDFDDTPSTDTPYTLVYTASSGNTQYELTPYTYNGSGVLTVQNKVSGVWGTVVNLNESLLDNMPAGHGDDCVFIGWKEYDPDGATEEAKWGDLVSTNPNFGYTLTDDITVAAYFGTQADKEAIYEDAEWNSYIDKNEITQELTDENTGTIYNDNLLRFQFGADTMKMIDQDHYDRTHGVINIKDNDDIECGLLILAQTAESKETYGSAFNELTDDDVKTYAEKMVQKGYSVAKLKAATYGTAYAYRTKIDSLSRLNRAHIYQALDYDKYSNGYYKVMAYYVDETGTTHYSDVISSVYTKGVKS